MEGPCVATANPAEFSYQSSSSKYFAVKNYTLRVLNCKAAAAAAAEKQTL